MGNNEKKDKVKVSKSDLYQVINDKKDRICNLKVDNAEVHTRNVFMEKALQRKNKEISGLRAIVFLLLLALAGTIWGFHP